MGLHGEKPYLEYVYISITERFIQELLRIISKKYEENLQILLLFWLKQQRRKEMIYVLWKIMAIGMDCLSFLLLFAPWILVLQKMAGRKIWSLQTGFLLLYVCTLAGIFSVTGLPNIKYCKIDFSANFIPMADILNSPMQYFLNVLMFLPVGFLLPLLWETYNDWKYTLGFGCFLTVLIEIAQVFTFRTTDIDDLLTNLLGAGLGFLLARALGQRLSVPLPPEPGTGRMEKAGPWVILLAAFCVNFFIEPYWSAFFWDHVL